MNIGEFASCSNCIDKFFAEQDRDVPIVFFGSGFSLPKFINDFEGRGFTIAQLAVVVNALIGVYWLKDPQPKTRAATLTLAGCVLAMAGGIVLGNLK